MHRRNADGRCRTPRSVQCSTSVGTLISLTHTRPASKKRKWHGREEKSSKSPPSQPKTPASKNQNHNFCSLSIVTILIKWRRLSRLSAEQPRAITLDMAREGETLVPTRPVAHVVPRTDEVVPAHQPGDRKSGNPTLMARRTSSTSGLLALLPSGRSDRHLYAASPLRFALFDRPSIADRRVSLRSTALDLHMTLCFACLVLPAVPHWICT